MATSQEDKSAPIIISKIVIMVVGSVAAGLMLRSIYNQTEADTERAGMKKEQEYFRRDIERLELKDKELDQKDKEQDSEINHIKNDVHENLKVK